MIGWSPYAIFALIKQYGNKDLISPAMGVIPSIFAKITICYNPIIYVGLNTQFRQAFDRFRGIQPPTKMRTVSTTANLLDTDAKEIIKTKLKIANTNEELQLTPLNLVGNVDATVTVVEIEMNVFKEEKCNEKTVKIQIE